MSVHEHQAERQSSAGLPASTGHPSRSPAGRAAAGSPASDGSARLVPLLLLSIHPSIVAAAISNHDDDHGNSGAGGSGGNGSGVDGNGDVLEMASNAVEQCTPQ